VPRKTDFPKPARLALFSLVLVIAAVLSGACAGLEAAGAAGPLRVSSVNPRYFSDPAGRVIYLTGSHTWANLQDQGPQDPPAAFDYPR
jgi:hypothetical protein